MESGAAERDATTAAGNVHHDKERVSAVDAAAERKDRRRKRGRGGKVRESIPPRRRDEIAETDRPKQAAPTKLGARQDPANEILTKMVRWKRRTAHEARGAEPEPGQQQGGGPPAQRRAAREDTTAAAVAPSKSKPAERRLYEPDAGTMVPVHGRPGRGRGRELTHRVDGTSGSDSAGEPFTRRALAAPRGRGGGMTRGGGSARGSGVPPPGRRRGVPRGAHRGGFGPSRRFDSDDDENWYVRGRPVDEDEPLQSAASVAATAPTSAPTPIAVDTFRGEAVLNRDTTGRVRHHPGQTRLPGNESAREPNEFVRSRSNVSATATRAPPTPGRQLYDPDADRMTQVRTGVSEGRSARSPQARVRVGAAASAASTERNAAVALPTEISRLEKRVARAMRSSVESDIACATLNGTNAHAIGWREKLDLCERQVR
ncbi:hypothetical protein THASP1DRAFT_27135 [Thamnocephalis sphaerospora]|uniref:Uncharacterized protein n=1 Tax=Thamnocephalis sphaerospora TaxID=78915 RepID=A0A4P9XZC1_9FUNG|nr:hypothetical protein THASP1DRAFT_27135 [Thamnocephalis sphaerospora]|eukprot:RKP11101.1 hypothetical protein THASP1DRAFT_27135 [Thamnocephalis sphaerospora]